MGHLDSIGHTERQSNVSGIFKWQKPVPRSILVGTPSSIHLRTYFTILYVEAGFRMDFKGLVYHIQEYKLTAIYHMEYYSFLLLPLENMNIRKRFVRQWFFMKSPEVKTPSLNFFLSGLHRHSTRKADFRLQFKTIKYISICKEWCFYSISHLIECFQNQRP